MDVTGIANVATAMAGASTNQAVSMRFLERRSI